MLARVLALLAPPLCATCGSPCAATDPMCPTCSDALAATRGGTAGLPGAGPVTWAASYEGVARDLVTALKFGGRLPLAAAAAVAMAATIEAPPGATLVAVPPAPARRRRRGFDPAHLIADELARLLGLERSHPLRRADGPRQVGRPRRDRLASPPRVRAMSRAPTRVIVVDDVLTTGATLTACAKALRDAGSSEIHLTVFARALGVRASAA